MIVTSKGEAAMAVLTLLEDGVPLVGQTPSWSARSANGAQLAAPTNMTQAPGLPGVWTGLWTHALSPGEVAFFVYHLNGGAIGEEVVACIGTQDSDSGSVI